MKTPSTSFLMAVLVLTALILLQYPPTTASAGCNPSSLRVCAGAISHPSRPSHQCCSRLRQQRRCFCQYLRNPAFRRFVNPAQAKKILSGCRIRAPRC